MNKLEIILVKTIRGIYETRKDLGDYERKECRYTT